MRRILILTLLISYGCKDKNPLVGKYEGLWYDTWWQIEIKNESEFVFTTNGHCCTIESKGTYLVKGDTITLYPPDSNRVKGLIETKFLIDGDSCLIGIETKFDYCKEWPEEWASRERTISYPQTKPHSIKDKEDVLMMLQEAINRIASKHVKDTTANLIVKEYAQINKSNQIALTKFGKPAILLSEQEISTKGIKNYVEIEQIKLGLESASVHLKIEPYFDTYGYVLLHANKMNGEWIINK